MNVLSAASAATILAGLVLAGAGSARVEAHSTGLSTPPTRAYAVDVARGRVGGLRLDVPASDYIRRLGIPDFVGRLEATGGVEMLWSRSAEPVTGWATATLAGPSSPKVEQLRFAGLFTTARGDRRGTTLDAFLRHWKGYAPRVVRITGRGGRSEYNVVVGMVVFGFDDAKRLRAVGLAAPKAAARLCVIPSVCVVPRVS